ncbi:MAG: carboxypeptidase regulatory-like domain-containing protein [Candidatus Acidiferrum sp.]
MASRGSVLSLLGIVFVGLLFLFSQSVSAQITSEKGAIRIALTDPQGASIAGAKVSVTSKTGTAQVKESNADGSVVFPLLDPGNYDVTVESPNFKRTVLNNVAVHVTEVTNLNVTLELGAVSSEVVVSGETAQTVNTSNATLGNVLTQKSVQDLPLSTRNFTFLLALNAGTSTPLSDATQAGRGEAVINVAGQRGTANNLVINGTDSNELLSNNFSRVPVPSPDSIEEFRVQTSLYDASQGKTAGGNVDVLTRGGTSAYHGEAYEFFRNDDMNANLYFFNATGTPRPVLKQNQFGGNFGGPLPSFGDNPIFKDTFFFGSYEGTRQINGVAGSAQADFPVLPAQRTEANIESAFGLAPGSLNPVALALLNAPGHFNGFLIPSGTGTPGSFGEATFSEPLLYNENQFNINFDKLIGDKNKISERFFYSNSNTINPLGGEDSQSSVNNSFGSGDVTPNDNRLATIAWTSTISPNLINEARFGYNRITLAITAAPTASLASVGMTRFNSSTIPEIPLLLTGDIDPEFGGPSTNFDQQDVDNTFNFADTLAWTRGKHTFRMGVEYRRYQINLFNNFAENGFLFFNSFQDFLLGNFGNGETFVGSGITNRDFRGNDLGGYFQDDWKIFKRLTLNLGLRYDYMGPLSDTKDRIGNFDPSLLDATTRENAGPGILNGFILPAGASFGAIQGTPGVSPSTLLSNSPHNFAPRVGFAWDPKGDGKTSIRGGYGIYYVRTSGQTLLQLITSQPFFQLSANAFGPTAPAGVTLANPFPVLPTANQFPIYSVPPTFTGFDPSGNATFSGNVLALNPFDRNLVTPYTGNWNLSIQRELPFHFNVEIGYIGSEGVHLIDSLQRNQALLANAANPITVGGANGVPQTVLTTNSVNDVEARAGVLGFDAGGGLNEVTDLGHSSYNALVFTVNHRTGNLFLQASYTYSKSMDNESGGFDQDLGSAPGNQLDLRSQRAVSDFNVPQRIVVAYEYGLPGFKSGPISYTLGHWSIGGVTTFQTGLPANITCGICSANLFGPSPTSTLPNLVGNFGSLMLSGSPEKFTGTTSVFNSSVLAAPAPLAGGTQACNLNVFGGPGNQCFTIGPSGGALFGDLGRNVVHGPFDQNWDMYLTKNFPITEKYSLTLRSEFFNIFNHPNFVLNNTAFGTAPFGIYSSTVGNPRILQLALKFDF